MRGEAQIPPRGRENGRGFRMARGDLRYVMLDLLKDQPSYGYELTQALEERFHGFYSPSAGHRLSDTAVVAGPGLRQRGRAGRPQDLHDHGGRAARPGRAEKRSTRFGSGWVFGGARPRCARSGESSAARCTTWAGRCATCSRTSGMMRVGSAPKRLAEFRLVIARASREIAAILREPETDSTGAADAEAQNA